MSASSVRLSAAERRLDLLETALRLFTEGSYRGTTTAEIARAAGVSEPILYRHFSSKRDLYLAALDHLWAKTRTAWEEALASAPDVRTALELIGRGHFGVRACKLRLPEIWMQGLSEAADDSELRKSLRRHMHEVHNFLADVIRGGQADGSIGLIHDAEAEAWLLVAGGMLGMVGRRVGLLDDADLARIRGTRMKRLSQ